MAELPHLLDPIKTRFSAVRRGLEAKTNSVLLTEFKGKKVEDILGDIGWSAGAGFIAKRAAGIVLNTVGGPGWVIKAGGGAFAGAAREYVRQMRDLSIDGSYQGIAKKKYDAAGALEQSNVDHAKAELDAAQAALDAATTPATIKAERAEYRKKKRAYNEILRLNLKLGLRDALRPENFTKVDARKIGKAAARGAVFGVIGETIGQTVIENLGTVIGGAGGGFAGQEVARRRGANIWVRIAAGSAGAVVGGAVGTVAENAISGHGVGGLGVGKPDTGGGGITDRAGKIYHGLGDQKEYIRNEAAIGAVGGGAINKARGGSFLRGAALGAGIGAVAGELTGLAEDYAPDIHVGPIDKPLTPFSGVTDVPHQIGEVEVGGKSIAGGVSAITDQIHAKAEGAQIDRPVGWMHDRMFGEGGASEAASGRVTPPTEHVVGQTTDGRIPDNVRDKLFEASRAHPTGPGLSYEDARNAGNVSPDYRIGNTDYGIRAVFSNNDGMNIGRDIVDWTKPNAEGWLPGYREIEIVNIQNHIPYKLDGHVYMDAQGKILTTLNPKNSAFGTLQQLGLVSKDVNYVSNDGRFGLDHVLHWQQDNFGKPEAKPFNFGNTHIELVDKDHVNLQNINYLDNGKAEGPILENLKLDVTSDGHRYISFTELQQKLNAIPNEDVRKNLLDKLTADGWYQDGDHFLAPQVHQLELPTGIDIKEVVLDARPSGANYVQTLSNARGEDIVAHISPAYESSNVVSFSDRVAERTMNHILPKSFEIQNGDTFWSAAQNGLPHINEGWIDHTTYLSQKDIFITTLESLAKAHGIDVNVGNFDLTWLSPQEKLQLFRLLQAQSVGDYYANVRPGILALLAQLKNTATDELTAAA